MPRSLEERGSILPVADDDWLMRALQFGAHGRDLACVVCGAALTPETELVAHPCVFGPEPRKVWMTIVAFSCRHHTLEERDFAPPQRMMESANGIITLDGPSDAPEP